MIAAAGEVDSTEPDLMAAQLTPLIDEARRRLASHIELDASTEAILDGLEFTIIDLPGALVARFVGDGIEVDVDAAGHGWFVDPTPTLDEEYTATGEALEGSGAEDDVDLLSTLVHELGHAVGLTHDDEEAFMADEIYAGQRTAFYEEQAVDQHDIEDALDRVYSDALDGLVSVEEFALLEALGIIDEQGRLLLPGLTPFTPDFDYEVQEKNWQAVVEEVRDEAALKLSANPEIDEASGAAERLQPGSGGPEALIDWTGRSRLTGRLASILEDLV